MTEAVVDQRRTVDVLGFANPLNLPSNAESATHVYVYADDVLLTNGVEYTLDGVDDLGDLDAIAGVDVTFDTDFLLDAADLYTTFTVEHVPPADQQSDLSSGGTLGRLYMAALDAIMRRVQSFYQNFTQRSLQLPPNAVDIDVILPVPEDRRGLVWELDADTGEYRLVNSYSDPDTEPLTDAEEAATAAEAAQTAAEAAQAEATAQALAAADSADRAEEAAANAGDLSALLNYLWPVGATMMFNGRSAPANFLKENAAAVSRTTYSALWSVLHTEATVTFDTATDLCTWTAHGLAAGDTVRFYTTGALPTGLTANTTYYVISSGLTADAFKVSASSGGSAINLTGSPSGTHTAHNAPYGYGDGTTTFNVPESRGEFIRGLDDSRGVDSSRRLGAAQSEQIGPHTHTASIASGGAHTHTYTATARRGANGDFTDVFRPSNGDSTSPTSTPTLTTTSNGDHTHSITINNNSGTENRPRNVPKLICIKY